MPHIKLGMLTPSSNTVLEPVTNNILKDVPGVVAHYSRFRVTEVNLTAEAANQFSFDSMLDAAQLLADAKVDVIAYNGTSGGWLGFDHDEELCARIKIQTGIPATTSVLALNELLLANKITHFGLVSPCEETIVHTIIQQYNQIGITCTAFACSGETDNYKCADIDHDQITDMIAQVASTGERLIITFGTNLWSAPLVEELERKFDIVVIDTITAVVHKCLMMSHVDHEFGDRWGKVLGDKGIITL